MLIERIVAVSGYNSHKEIDFGSKLALPALLADLRIIEMNNTTVWLSLLPNNEENSFCMFHMVNRENNWEFV